MARTLLLVLVFALGPAAFAQTGPVSAAGNVSVSLVASGIPLTALEYASIAADWRGNVYVADQGSSIFGTSTVIHRVTAAGAVVQNNSFVGDIAQIAYNPTDGEVYVLEIAGSQSLYCRINVTGGTTLLQFAPIVAEGVTVADDGTYYVGGTDGADTGVFAYDGTANTVTFLGPGFSLNTYLTARPDGTLLGLDPTEARYISTTTGQPLASYATPAAGSKLEGLGRGSLNGFDDSVIFAEVDAASGSASLIVTAPDGSGPITLATETWAPGGPYLGVQQICSGPRREVFWLVQDTANTGALYRIEEIPTAGFDGSLIVNRTPTTLSLSISGPAGQPFLFGLIPTALAGGALFGGPAGVFEVNFTRPDYLPVFDGAGVFAPLNPLAVIPPSGVFAVSFNVAALPQPLSVISQALILDADSPNLSVDISNPSTFTL